MSATGVLTAATGNQPSQNQSAGTTPTDTEIHGAVLNATEKFFFVQAEKAIQANIRYGAFIIMCAGLHFLASLQHGRNVNIDGTEIKTFCETHLPGYDANALWASFRNGFFHRGVPQSPQGTQRTVIVIAGASDKHDPDGSRNIRPGYVVLNAETFLADLRTARDSLLAHAERDAMIMQNFRGIYNEYMPVEFAL